MLRTHCGDRILPTNDRSITGRAFPISVCCLVLLCGVPRAARAMEPAMIEASEKRIDSLFNGRDFRGWIQSGNWKIENGAFYFSQFIDGRHNDLRYANKVPRNCEIRFEWKERKSIKAHDTGDHEVQQLNPGLSISLNVADPALHRPNSSYGAAIDYYISGTCVRLHTRDLDDDSPLHHMYKSSALDRWPTKDFSRPSGEWNESRILVKGPEIRFWLNGKKAYDIDLRNKVMKREGEEDLKIDELDAALDVWLKRGGDGVYLSVIPPYSDAFAAEHLEFRSLTISPEV